GELPYSSVRIIAMQKLARFAPEMKRLCPLSTQLPFLYSALLVSCLGSEPVPGCGSVIPKQDCISAAARGARYSFCCSGVAIIPIMCRLPSSGAIIFNDTGPIGE